MQNEQSVRAARESERQRNFRDSYVAATPAWYRGEYHLAFMLVVTLGTLAFCISQLRKPSVGEWLMVIPIFLFGNWVEWAAHRYVLHRPVRRLEAVYKRHCGVHHQFFTNHDLTYRGQKHWRALLFPPFASIGFILVSIPPALIVAAVWSANAGFIMVGTMAVYYLMYEGLHTLSHLDDARHPYLRWIPLVNTVRSMHVVHHNLGFMQTRNFNLTFPICDALFGTSHLDRGLLGTLFNGASERHVRRDLRPANAPVGFGLVSASGNTVESPHGVSPEDR